MMRGGNLTGTNTRHNAICARALQYRIADTGKCNRTIASGLHNTPLSLRGLIQSNAMMQLRSKKNNIKWSSKNIILIFLNSKRIQGTEITKQPYSRTQGRRATTFAFGFLCAPVNVIYGRFDGPHLTIFTTHTRPFAHPFHLRTLKSPKNGISHVTNLCQRVASEINVSRSPTTFCSYSSLP